MPRSLRFIRFNRLGIRGQIGKREVDFLSQVIKSLQARHQPRQSLNPPKPNCLQKMSVPLLFMMVLRRRRRRTFRRAMFSTVYISASPCNHSGSSSILMLSSSNSITKFLHAAPRQRKRRPIGGRCNATAAAHLVAAAQRHALTSNPLRRCSDRG